MPAKNRTKLYSENSYYHLYNRGVEKRDIFLDQQDYNVFLSYLRNYLLPKDESSLIAVIAGASATPREKDAALRLLRLNNFSEEIKLLAYCLMENHFHFLIKQKGATSIDKFMNSLCTRYTMYFNKKYKRVGALYQGVYKAVMVVSEEQLLHLTRYIHLQAIEPSERRRQRNSVVQPRVLQPCSYLDYLGKQKTAWVDPSEVLMSFSATHSSFSYQTFMLEENNPEPIADLVLE